MAGTYLQHQTVLAMRLGICALPAAYQPQFSPLFLRGRITDLRAGTHRDAPSRAVEAECTAISDPGPRNHSVLGRVHVGWLLFTAARDGRGPGWQVQNHQNPRAGGPRLFWRSYLCIWRLYLDVSKTMKMRDTWPAPRLVSCQCWCVAHDAKPPRWEPGGREPGAGTWGWLPSVPNVSLFSPARCDWKLR